MYARIPEEKTKRTATDLDQKSVFRDNNFKLRQISKKTTKTQEKLWLCFIGGEAFITLNRNDMCLVLRKRAMRNGAKTDQDVF